MHLGFDVSDDQHPGGAPIDWGAALGEAAEKGGAAPFAWVQVDPANPMALGDVAALTAASPTYSAGAGAYVYLDWSQPIAAQAQWAIDSTPSHWPVACDLESVPPGTPFPAILAGVDEFCRTVTATGRATANYTDLSWYEGEGDPTSYPLWLAEPGASAPSRPCLIWQSSFTGAVAGIAAAVDLDAWIGEGPGALSFEEFFGLRVVAPPLPPITVLHTIVDSEEGSMKVVAVPIDTDANGDGWRQTETPWANLIGAMHQGSDPAPDADDGYWPGSVHVQERNGNVLVSVTGARPSATSTVFLVVAT